jgi:lysophospholipid acyltransferase (LPLAT)-like uncharacterized protein
MRLFRAFSRSETVRRPLCWLAAQYIRLVHHTGRWETEGGAIAAEFWDRDEPFILAFWHGRILMMPYCWRRAHPINMLISSHRDGLMIARTVSHFGIDTVAGSTTRGGTAALRTMLKSLKDGVSVGITPDGPHGPYMRASDGVVQLARLSGAKIIPCTYAAARRRVIGSWDRFVLAWPFSRGVFLWGQPIAVARDADETALEAARLAVERSLNALTREADARMGQRSLVPAEAAS